VFFFKPLLLYFFCIIFQYFIWFWFYILLKKNSIPFLNFISVFFFFGFKAVGFLGFFPFLKKYLIYFTLQFWFHISSFHFLSFEKNLSFSFPFFFLF